MATFTTAAAAAMLSTNNEERRAAEAVYRQALNASAEAVVQVLVQSLMNRELETSVRMISAVLLRQLLDHTKKTWQHVSPQTRAATRVALLQQVFSEPEAVIARRISHCIAQAASSEHGPWPELLQTVCSAMSTGLAQACTALFILEQLPDYSPELMHGNAMNLLPVYSGALEPSQDLKIRVAALKATGTLLTALENDKERAPFAPLVQPTLQAIAAALQGGHEADAQDVLTSLVSVAQQAVDFFRADLPSVVDAMLQITAAGEQLDQQTCERALELLITLCQYSPARVRRCPSVLHIVDSCFDFMCQIDDDEDETREWMQGKYDDFIDDEEAYVFGDEAMERVLEALGKALLPKVLSCIPANIQDGDWRKRRAAMACVEAAASSASKALKPNLAECMRALFSGAADPHPRVRFAAVGAIAGLCAAYPGEIQKAHHAQLPAALVQIISDPTQCPRVRGHACACVVNFCDPEKCEPEFLQPYSDLLLQSLVTCLGNNAAPPEVMEEALGAVTRIAQVCDADFARFYPSFMPGILGILANANGPELQRLRGKAMQCVGIIGTAVGADVFRNDALQVLQALMPAMQCSGGQFPEGYFEYFAPAAAQISHALKEQFAPFLPTVIPPLLHTLGMATEVSITEVDASTELSGTGAQASYQTASGQTMESTIFQARGGNKMRLTMNTTAVMEKQMAAKTLFEYINALGVTMVEYIEAAAEKILPLVIFKYSEDVRNSAAFCCSKIFAAAVEAARPVAANNNAPLRPPQFAAQLLNPFVEQLLTGIKGEIHAEPRACMSEALRDILQACLESNGKDAPLGSDGLPPPPSICLDAATADRVAAELAVMATDSCTRRQKKSAEFEQSDELEAEDQERLEEELTEEEELMTNLVDCTGYLLKCLRQPNGAVTTFDRHVAPLYGQFLNPAAPATLRHNAICLYDDMLEFGGASSMKYLNTLAPLLVSGLDAEEAWERQACVYGIMQMAKHLPQAFAQVYSTVTPKLIAMVNHPEAREDENTLVTENCISTLGAIARTPAAAPAEAAQLLQLWLAKLPLRDDAVEAKLVHKQLCELVETSHPAITGNDFEQLPKVLAVFAQILESIEAHKVGEEDSLIDAPTRDRIVAIVRQFQTQLPGPRLASAWSSLTQPMQQAVEKALS